ncbi:aminotransferase class I/II-fold pyridoxal phosphate-dependent enzyme [Alteromonas genovensis]|uniref:aminotransferase class I/II-fold pyridoxal phosphate-dependent enzyme n=1 Tax=Alteromonas genovensis TaxID=471225 RepID=UPI002FE31A64
MPCSMGSLGKHSSGTEISDLNSSGTNKCSRNSPDSALAGAKSGAMTEAGAVPAEFLVYQDVWERVHPHEYDVSSRLKFSAVSSRYPNAPADTIAMWIADMDTKPLPEISAYVADTVQNAYGYQDSDIGETVQGWFEAQQCSVNSGSVVSVASVIGAVDVALKTFCVSGDEVMVLTPTYGPLVDCINNNTLKVHAVHTNRDENGDDTIDLSLLSNNATAFVLCHPNNPTGQVLSASCQSELIQFCNEHGILIITDEIHSEFGFLSNDEPLPIPLFGSHCDAVAQKGIIHISSVSKAFNLAAIPGASYAIIEDPVIRAKFSTAIASRHLEASYLSQVALKAAYSLGHTWLDNIRKALGLNRKLVHFYFKQQNINCEYTMGKAGYFLWLNLSKAATCADENASSSKMSQKSVFNPASTFDSCVSRGVIGSDGSQFNAPGWIRLNIACHPLQIVNALDRLFFR